MKLLAGTANAELSRKVAQSADVPLIESQFKRFPDSEIYLEILENVRGEDVFIIQPTCNPVNDHLMELLLTIDAARRGSAQRITAVIPYFGYARQDRKTGPRTPISAKLIANMIEKAGANRVLTVDLHAGQIQGFFDIPTDNLYAVPVLARDAKVRNQENTMVISPDVGGVVRARAFAKRLQADLGIIDKRRSEASHSKVMHVIGDVKGRRCILIDDIVDSAGTLCNAADALVDHGAIDVQVYATHGVFSGEAIERIEQSSISSFCVTDTIPNHSTAARCPKIRTLSLAPLLADAIQRIAYNHSVSVLFD